MRFPTALPAFLVVTSCVLSLENPVGRRCDSTHACATGSTCVAGRCQSTAAGGGSASTGGGTGVTGGGGGSLGGGAAGGGVSGGGLGGGDTGGGLGGGSNQGGGVGGSGGGVGGGVSTGGSSGGGSTGGGDAQCSCPLTAGVCANAIYRCLDGAQTCQYGTDYETQETKCDQKDNDCDGIVDDVKGCVLTAAGTEPFGFIDGPGPTARFAYPAGVAIAPNGDVLVADSYNHAIRRVTPTGQVTTVVGQGKCGHVNGPVAQALLCTPKEIAVASNGDIYFTDSHNVRIISNGNVSTLAGGGLSTGLVDAVGTAARFNTPHGLTFIPGGDLLVADAANSRIRRVAPDGTTTTYAGTNSGSADGDRLMMQFNNPMDVVVLPDGLVVPEQAGYRLRKVPDTGSSSTFAGTGVVGYLDGPPATARFNLPMRAKMGSDGLVYVADTWNHLIRTVPTDGGAVKTVVKYPGGSYNDGLLSSARGYAPRALDVRDQRIVFVDDNMNVRNIDLDAGTMTTLAGVPPERQAQDGPLSTATIRYIVDSAMLSDGGIVFSQADAQPLRRFAGGRIDTLLLSGSDLDGPLSTARVSGGPNALTMLSNDRLVFYQSNNCKFRMIDFPAGTLQTIAGTTCDRTTVVNGTLSTAKFGDVRRAGVVKQGGQQVLFLSQCDQGVIRTMNLTTGVVDTLAGVAGMVDANGVDGPKGTGLVALRCTEAVDDGNGGAYFGNKNRIRHVDSAGNLTSLAAIAPGTIEGIAREGNLLFLQVGNGGVYSVDLSTPSIMVTEFQSLTGWRDGLSGTAGFYSTSGLELTPTQIYINDFYRIRRLWR